MSRLNFQLQHRWSIHLVFSHCSCFCVRWLRLCVCAQTFAQSVFFILLFSSGPSSLIDVPRISLRCLNFQTPQCHPRKGIIAGLLYPFFPILSVLGSVILGFINRHYNHKSNHGALRRRQISSYPTRAFLLCDQLKLNVIAQKPNIE